MAENCDEDAADVLVKLVNSLGGPFYAAENVAWASAMPQGRELLQWVASQIQRHTSPNAPFEDDTLEYQIAMEDIALHEQEIHEIGLATSGRFDDLSSRSTPAEYMRPATLRASSRFTEEEADLLENETRLLKHRLNRSKAAAGDLMQRLRSLQAEVDATDAEIRQRDATLSELSINADTAVSRSARTAGRLLDGTTTKDATGQSKTVPLQQSFSNASRLHESVATTATRQLQSIEKAVALLPTAAEVKQEAARLHVSIERLRDRVNARPGAGDMFNYCAQLDTISQLLESAPDEEKRAVIEALLVDKHSTGPSESDVDVKEEIARAWSLDQRAILLAREKMVDETAERLTATLLPMLGELYSALAARSEHATETEALVSVLVEELEEITDDVAAVGSTEPDGRARTKRAHEALEDELAELLKSTQSHRPRGAGPLVLLDRADIAKELVAVRERAEEADIAEAAWTASLKSQLAGLSCSHADLLSVVYEDAPVNTSPPFGMPADTRALEKSLTERIGHLDGVVQRLQKDSQLNERDKRKLTAFVEKWAR